MPTKLHIPGPVEVSPATYAAMCTPVIGHRGGEFVKLYQGMQPKLQTLFMTKDPVYLSTSSAWGVMEGAVRNVTRKKVLNCCNGAFSDKWHEVSLKCGLAAGAVKAEWGNPIDPDAVYRELSTGQYDAITLIHNETSCGLLNPLAEIMAVVRQFPEVISIVDTVSSFSALAIDKDALGIDIMLTGSQKALAMPPGLAIFSVSAKALARAAQTPNRGYYFDLLEFQANHEKGMTPSTPVLPLIFALRHKVDEILAEGLENRYARHLRLNLRLRQWAWDNGFCLFPAYQCESVSLVCLANTRRLDTEAFLKRLKADHAIAIDGGYGKIKGKTMRISNMGDETDATITTLLAALDDTLAKVPPAD